MGWKDKVLPINLTVLGPGFSEEAIATEPFQLRRPGLGSWLAKAGLLVHKPFLGGGGPMFSSGKSGKCEMTFFKMVFKLQHATQNWGIPAIIFIHHSLFKLPIARFHLLLNLSMGPLFDTISRMFYQLWLTFTESLWWGVLISVSFFLTFQGIP